MRPVCLTETHVQGLYWGSDNKLYARTSGVERQCSLCGNWVQTLFRSGGQEVCERHIRVTRTRIRLTTTFACRVYLEGSTDQPPAKVLRRNDMIDVAGRPERVGRFDKFTLPDRSGFVLVPRSRWAWANR